MSLNLGSRRFVSMNRYKLSGNTLKLFIFNWHSLMPLATHYSSAFSSSVNIRRWTYVCYCRSAVTQKLFLTGPEIFRRAEWKETIDSLDQTSCDRLFRSEMVLRKNEYL